MVSFYLDIGFDGRVLNTSVYVKMDSPNDLLLSEGVCRQLGNIHYRPEVRPVKDTGKSISWLSLIQDSADVPWVKICVVSLCTTFPIKVFVHRYSAQRRAPLGWFLCTTRANTSPDG